MKKFVLTTAVLGAALGLAACDPKSEEEAVAPEETTMEAPAEETAPMDDAAGTGGAPEDGMEADGMTGAEEESDDGRGNPIDM